MWEHFEGEEDWPVHGISYDDLVRLVVGMQWQMAILLSSVDSMGPDIDLCSDSAIKPAVDIVDEWLGVR